MWLTVSLGSGFLAHRFPGADRYCTRRGAHVVSYNRQATQRTVRKGTRWLRYLGKISYALFLVHFSVLLLANAAFAGLGFSSPVAGGIGMLPLGRESSRG